MEKEAGERTIDLELVKKVRKSRFFERLDKAGKERYMELLGQIYEDTDGGLSHTEYENLVTLSFVCEEFERTVLSDGFDLVDVRMFAEYRKAKETILRTMRENRENFAAIKNTIDDAKEVLKKLDLVSGDDDKNTARKKADKDKRDS